MKIVHALAAAAALALPGMASAAPVFFESFETPNVGGDISYGDPASMYNGGAGAAQNGGPFGYASAPNGVQVAHLQVGGVVTLSLTDLLVGQLYSVSFQAAQRNGYAVLPINVLFDNAVIGSFTPTSTAFTATGPYTFTATTTTGSLQFAGNDNGVGGDLNTGIDAVSVAAVPEPATWGMMILGFGMAGFGMRRRKSNVRTAVRFA